MSKSENQKQKLLLLETFFQQQTDEAHPASMQDILSFLAENGISAERKSIYSDLQVLQEHGMDLMRTPGKAGGYFLASRTFELAELKLLVDAVQSCKFLTDRKSNSLIKKLGTLASRYEAQQLRRQVTVSGRVKTMNESIYYNVDRLHDAIARNSQIQFRYFDWAIDGTRRFRDREYIASPYALCWDDENYYLIAHSARHGLTHYRVDKMMSITATGEPRVQTQESRELNLAAYAKKVFGMFSGEETNVRLRFHSSLAGVIFDRFGHDCMLIPDGESHFTVTLPLAVSPLFLGWLAGFGERAEILYPPQVVEQYRTLLHHALAPYEKTSSNKTT